MTEDLLLKLRGALQRELPGRPAQLLMAPSLRPAGSPSFDGTDPRASGVMILLFPTDGRLSTAFIQRTKWGPHGGQISLPGGKVEPSDPNIIFTALRETYEEIGVDPSTVETIGMLTPLYVPHSNYLISPVVGYLPALPEFSGDDHEVESIIIISLSELFHPSNRKTMTIHRSEGDIEAPYYEASGHRVWGATAVIMSELEVMITS